MTKKPNSISSYITMFSHPANRKMVERLKNVMGNFESGNMGNFVKDDECPIVRRLAEFALLVLGDQEGVVELTPVEKPRKRTCAEVMLAKRTVSGCCGQHADNKACDCLRKCSDYKESLSLLKAMGVV